MRKSIILTCLVAVASMLLTACGGVDQSNPQTVAEHVMKSFKAGDFEKIKTVVHPENENLLNEIDGMIKLMNENPEYKVPEEASYEFNSIRDNLRGGEATDQTTEAAVCFDTKLMPGRVIVEKKEGKWYFISFKG